MSQAYKNIILIGFMGSGKSSVGKDLARICGLRFMDLDAMIESKKGMLIKDIFAAEGENSFRHYETETLLSLKGTSGAVIATGGGIVTRFENLVILKKMGVVVYLRARFDTLLKRISLSDHRPLANSLNRSETLKSLLKSRKCSYEKADMVIDTDAFDESQVVRHILDRLGDD